MELAKYMRRIIKRIYHLFYDMFDVCINKDMAIVWVKKSSDSKLALFLPGNIVRPQRCRITKEIEGIARATNNKGAHDLWVGYHGSNNRGTKRFPNDVRTHRLMGQLYCFLVGKIRPRIIVEFGAAFGVSGMYFLAGLRRYSVDGTLLSFEPNEAWAKIAEENLSKVSGKFRLSIGTFEDGIDEVLPDGKIDLAFIDAIHTREFVVDQLDIVVSKSNSGAIILLDDINFSDSMRDCWNHVSVDERFCASAKLGDRVGVLELK